MSGSVCLQWNDFFGSIKDTFRTLRDDKDFTDVTLVSGDGVQIEAHKVILLSTSPVFASLLKSKKQGQPIIYFRGIKSGDLQALVDFLYLGETTVQEEDVENFLNLGKDFQLEGLTESLPHLRETMPPTKKKSRNGKDQKDSKNFKLGVEEHENTGPTDFWPSSTKTLENVDEKIRSMMELSKNMLPNGKQRASKCKVCGKDGPGSNIKTHIEAHHLKFSIPCTKCERIFKSRAMMKAHKCKEQNDDQQQPNGVEDKSFYV